MTKTKKQSLALVFFAAGALTVFACNKESTDNAAAGTAATDTSATTSTIDTSGTETTGTTSTTSTGSSGGTISSLNTSDKVFVEKAAQGGMGEVKLGQLASAKATNPDVKAFGDHMVTDHSRLNDELKQLAQTKGMALPADVDKETQQLADKLSKLSGRDFDKEYINAMVNDHEKDVNEFDKMSKSANDPDLRAWVTKSLPTLQDHLRMAKDAKAKVK